MTSDESVHRFNQQLHDREPAQAREDPQPGHDVRDAEDGRRSRAHGRSVGLDDVERRAEVSRPDGLSELGMVTLKILVGDPSNPAPVVHAFDAGHRFLAQRAFPVVAHRHLASRGRAAFRLSPRRATDGHAWSLWNALTARVTITVGPRRSRRVL